MVINLFYIVIGPPHPPFITPVFIEGIAPPHPPRILFFLLLGFLFVLVLDVVFFRFLDFVLVLVLVCLVVFPRLFIVVFLEKTLRSERLFNNFIQYTKKLL
jgi:hypothetical protein